MGPLLSVLLLLPGLGAKPWPSVPSYDLWGDSKNDVPGVMNDSAGDVFDRRARVLNFFPIPVEEECNAADGHRKGICLNTYECRIQGGKSSGSCALGFGVCCILSCDAEVFNNITYFVNPNFPGLSRQISSCEISIKKIDPDISQFRLDFIHFHLGQPNRRTGVCDDDVFIMGGGKIPELKMCGLNSGQHVYFDVENIEEAVTIKMKLNKRSLARLWEVRVVQVPFTQRAPSGCLQYHTGMHGVVQTMNFADNGRHLAHQDYNICMRQENGMCSIAYQPCYENSFRIGPATIGVAPGPPLLNSGITPGAVFPAGAVEPGLLPGSLPGTVPGTIPGVNAGLPQPGDLLTEDEVISAADQEPVAVEQEPVIAEDEVVGSGGGPLPQVRMSSHHHCNDRIIMPCDSEDFIMPGISSPGMCELVHCGTNFCPPDEPLCRVESSVTPFTIGVQFGAASKEESPEDNLGMCLFYEQLPCAV